MCPTAKTIFPGMEQVLEACFKITGDNRAAQQLTNVMAAIIPMVREAIREELKSFKPLADEWYEPSEVSSMSGGRISAETVRNWFRWGQVDGESDGRQVRICKQSVVELQQNKWRPVRQPDPSKLPPSKRSKDFPSQSVAS